MFTRRSIVLLLGDVLTIILFVLIGRDSHSMAVGLEALTASLTTAAPFLVAWLIAAFALGAYRPKAWSSPKAAVLALLISFIPALILGSLLRALMLGRFSPITFYLVTAGFLFVMLLIWRLLFTIFLAPRIRA